VYRDAAVIGHRWSSRKSPEGNRDELYKIVKGASLAEGD
jgi:hypothetical protein